MVDSTTPDRPDSHRFLVALVLGLALRLTLVFTTLGTNDVIFKIMWANLATKHGVAKAYRHHPDLNHPPLSLASMRAMKQVADVTGIEYTNVFRLVQCVADLVTFLMLWRLAPRFGLSRVAVSWLFFLSPAAMFISAFHCNTDPTMVALVAVATWLLCRDKASFLWGGVALGAAAGIKILPLFLLPFFLVHLLSGRSSSSAPRPTTRVAEFLGGFMATVTLIFVPAIVVGGPVVARNIFGYSGFAGKWGLPALALTIEKFIAQPRSTWLYKVAYIYATQGKYLLVAVLGLLAIGYYVRVSRSSESSGLPGINALVFLTVLALAPGFGVQYLLWPLPFLPFLLEMRSAVVLNGAISVYLFVTYTIWSRGFPWWYADSIAPSPLKDWVTYLGLPLWIAIVILAWRAGVSHPKTRD